MERGRDRPDVPAAIADHVARLIPDHATIELGLGAIPQAVTNALGRKQGLGVHSGAIGDGIAHLMEAGIVDNRHKEIDPAVTVATMLMGTSRLYRFADRNPAIQIRAQIRATSYTHDALVLGNFRRFVAINGGSRSTSSVRSTPRLLGEDMSALSPAKSILYVPPTAPRRGVRSSRCNRPIANPPVRSTWAPSSAPMARSRRCWTRRPRCRG
jgi:hypothetical protein